MSSFCVSGSVVIPTGRRLDVAGLELEKATVTFVRGPSGCGKTSLMRKLCGSGQYGGTLSIRPAPSRIGFVTHDTVLVPWMSVEANVLLEARMRKAPVPTVECENYLATMGMDWSLVRRVKCSTLSLGMRQRVELARAMAFHPDLLLLDEAWSGVDGTHRYGVFSAVDGFLKHGHGCVLATTHADIDVLRLGDRLYQFEGAEISQSAVGAGLLRDRRREMHVAELWQSPDMNEMVNALGG